MATAKKQPSGNWQVQVYVGKDEQGKRKYKAFTAPTKKQAEYKAAEFMLNKKAAASGNITAGEAIDQYIESKAGVLSPSTLQSYKVLRRNNLQSLMNIKIHALTAAQVQKAISEDAKRLSPKSVRNAYALLSSSLKQYGIVFEAMLPQKLKSDIAIPTKQDIDKLLNADIPQDVRFAILLASSMGLRRSEICALKVADFDLKKKQLRINKAIVRGESEYHEKTTKTTSGTRTLPIPQIVLAEIEKNRLMDPIIKRSPNALTAFFDKLVKRELDAHIRFHDLRHYYASVLLSLGVPDKYAMELMGHSSANMLKNVYQHLMQDKKNEVASAIDAYFSSDAK